ncbi:MAG: hypothetical protein V4495_08905 [Pseudomonadota bacterium]
MINHFSCPGFLKAQVPNILALLAVSLLSAACVTTAPYIPPQSGAVVDLAVRIAPVKGTGFNLYVYDDAESCSGAKTIIDDAGKTNISATKLPADKLTTFGYSEMMGNTSCKVNFSFFPIADHKYVLDTVTGRGSCSARIVDATDVKKMFAVPLINRTVKGALCAPLKK